MKFTPRIDKGLVYSLTKKKENEKTSTRRCIIHLPSSFVHTYFPLVHLWPFQSLLFYRFLFLQPKHYEQQDPGARPKTKSVTLARIGYR